VTVADYDVVVVGAGPAGSACAISLAERGRRVLLLDKATFPRDKVCGDFLSPRSLAVLAELGCWDALRRAQPHSIRRSLVHLNGELVSTGPLPKVGRLPGFGMVVPRAVSDEILFRRAAAAGAEVVEGFVATDLELHESGITVRGRQTKRPRAVSAQLVVVADGARSRMAASLGVTPVSGQKDLFALRAYLHDVPSAPDATAVFFDADFFPGYAWVFPTGDGGANVGMGMHMDVCRRYGINLRDRFVRWMQDDPGLRSMVGDADRNVRIAGWPLTGYDGTHSNNADRVLIVGDAARFVDPINGEGVHTALESARLAAAVADRAIASGDLSAASLSAYERDWRAKFELDLRTSDLLVTIPKNRALLPLWLLIIRMVAERSMADPEFAASCGGIMAGIVPSHQGLSPRLAVRAAIQRPDFWLRHQGEALSAMTALMVPYGGEPSDQREFTIDWTRAIATKWAEVLSGLVQAYGVPWTQGRGGERLRGEPLRPLPRIVLSPGPARR
jgi:geranylgeranyl reductase family protein